MADGETTKEMVVHSNGILGSVDVSATDTMSDVRNMIQEEFDDDMLPSSSTDNQWFFWVNGIRKSLKQESRMLAWDAIKKGNIFLKPRNKRPLAEGGDAELEFSSNKRFKQDEEAVATTENASVTPADSPVVLQEQEPPQQQHLPGEDDAMKPIALDSKFQEKDPTTTTAATTATRATKRTGTDELDNCVILCDSSTDSSEQAEINKYEPAEKLRELEQPDLNDLVHSTYLLFRHTSKGNLTIVDVFQKLEAKYKCKLSQPNRDIIAAHVENLTPGRAVLRVPSVVQNVEEVESQKPKYKRPTTTRMSTRKAFVTPSESSKSKEVLEDVDDEASPGTSGEDLAQEPEFQGDQEEASATQLPTSEDNDTDSEQDDDSDYEPAASQKKNPKQPDLEDLVRSIDFLYVHGDMDRMTTKDFFTKLEAEYKCKLSRLNRKKVKAHLLDLMREKVQPLVEHQEDEEPLKPKHQRPTNTSTTNALVTPTESSASASSSASSSTSPARQQQLPEIDNTAKPRALYSIFEHKDPTTTTTTMPTTAIPTARTETEERDKVTTNCDTTTTDLSNILEAETEAPSATKTPASTCATKNGDSARATIQNNPDYDSDATVDMESLPDEGDTGTTGNNSQGQETGTDAAQEAAQEAPKDISFPAAGDDDGNDDDDQNVAPTNGDDQEEMEVAVEAALTKEQVRERNYEDAKKAGNAFDLCDSDVEVDVQPAPGGSIFKAELDAAAERKAAARARRAYARGSQPRISSSNGHECIDLCDDSDDDDDDDWMIPPPSGLRRKSSAFKSEIL